MTESRRRGPRLRLLSWCVVLLGQPAFGQDPGGLNDLFPQVHDAGFERPGSQAGFDLNLTQGSESREIAGFPEIPEPQFFDLVRSLGARQGEFESNVIMTYPFASSSGGGGMMPLDDQPPHGLTPFGDEEDAFEWSPEVEYAIFDGVALEFETPFEKSELEAYKFAGQVTFGTAFQNHYIHGTQVIVEPNAEFDEADLTFLYIAGVRFNEVWSAMAITGFSHIVAREDHGKRTERLMNLSIFADLCESVTVGVETNYATKLAGKSRLLVLPQVHLELTDCLELQSGFGVGFSDDKTTPGFSMRAIYER